MSINEVTLVPPQAESLFSTTPEHETQLEAELRAVVAVGYGEDTEIAGGTTILHSISSDTRSKYLVKTSTGLDIVIVASEIGMYASSSADTTDWIRSDRNAPASLGGLLTEDHGVVYDYRGDRKYNLAAYTSADGFNDAMTRIGRTSGLDVFKLVEVPEGFFSYRAYAQGARRGEILIAGEGLGPVVHDRVLTDHIQAWWSLPPDLFPIVQQRAATVLGADDEKKIENFAHGLDILAIAASELVPKLNNVLNDVLIMPESGRIPHLLNVIADSAKVQAPPEERPHDIEAGDAIIRSYALLGLIDMDIKIHPTTSSYPEILWPLIEDLGIIDVNSPIIHAAREDMALIMLQYVVNLADINVRLNSVREDRSEYRAEQQAALLRQLQYSIDSGEAMDYIHGALAA